MVPIFRLPKLDGMTDHEKLIELQRYLYQLVTDLQMAFNELGDNGGGGGAVDNKSSSDKPPLR